LGAGTDPTEGAALAQAVLGTLLQSKTRTVATTHYSELKSFASGHERVENASVEFDVETLRPTYRLMMGIPGRSNAFDISLRLGLDPAIIEGAKAFQSKGEARTANLIRDLETNQILTERERKEAETLRQQAAELLEWIQKKEEDTKARVAKTLEKAREEALELVTHARKESESLLKDMRELQKAGYRDIDEQAAQKIRENLRRQENGLHEQLESASGNVRRADEAAEPGDIVYLRKLKQKGQVLSKPNNQGEVQVQAGIMKLTVKLADIELLQEESAGDVEKQKTGAGAIGAGKAKTINTELDLRGKLVDEALLEVEKYLDDAFLAGLPQVNIIHGKGTGALRKAIRDMAVKHPFISGARQGGYNEGGDGVTIVSLKG
jgi:DNA mismatch repair protein MutS2